MLVALRGLTQDEAAAALGCTRGGVSEHWCNAAERLRRLEPELLARLREDG